MNIPESIFIKKSTNKGKTVKINVQLPLTEPAVYENKPVKTARMYDSKTNKLVAEWEI